MKNGWGCVKIYCPEYVLGNYIVYVSEYVLGNYIVTVYIDSLGGHVQFCQLKIS